MKSFNPKDWHSCHVGSGFLCDRDGKLCMTKFEDICKDCKERLHPAIISQPMTLLETLKWERCKKEVKGNRGSYDILGIAELDAKIELLEEQGDLL